MLGNMLNDLAEAIRRWTEKKQVNQSWVLFKQQAFNATGEDKFYLLSKLQKWASNKSNSSVLFVSLVFGVLFCFLDERDSA